MAAADIIEGQQAAMDVAEYPLKEAARPFSDIPGKNFHAECCSKQYENMSYSYCYWLGFMVNL